jgi:phosphatidylglycerol lysyltransferase
MDSRPNRDAVLALLRRFGSDAMSFLALEADMQHWVDDPPPAGTGGGVAYFDTGSAWVAAAGPIADAAECAAVAARFVAAGRARGRRASFFGTGAPLGPRFLHLLLGEEPIFRPEEWVANLPRRGRLREQLRRARAKGVTVRRVDADELVEGSALRVAIEGLAADWLRTRHMEPMTFLVALELFEAAGEHRYVVAERAGVPVGFLSAVPIYACDAWLVEDVVRAVDAPNGTTELLLDAFMRQVADASFVTLGLTPLSGAVAFPLRVARTLMRPLFDFSGLRAFRSRLHPEEWRPVYLVYPAGQRAVVPLVDALRAFANGRLLRFAARSVLAHPSGPPWLLALPLVPWTLALALLAVLGRPSLLGFSLGPRCGWVAFDALLALILYRTAMRPRVGALLFATLLATGDASLSILHLASVGYGDTPAERIMRFLALAAPTGGTFVLAWATYRAARSARALRRPQSV